MTFTDSGRTHAKETVEELLDSCEQSTERIACAVCGGPPAFCRTWRKDGTEMAAAYLCAEHRDTELVAEVTSW